MAITRTVQAIAKGDTKTASDQASFVIRTAAEDVTKAASAFRQSVGAAKARLMRR